MEKTKYDDKFTQVKLDNDFDSLFSPVIVGSLISIYTAYYLNQFLPHLWAYIWCCLVLIGGAGRLLTRYFYYKLNKQNQAKKWQYRYVLWTCYVGTLWASVSLLTINKIPVEFEVIIVTILLGMATGGAISNISNKIIAYYFSCSIIILHMIKVAVEQKQDWGYLIGAEIVFVMLVLKVIGKFNQIYEESLYMTFELKKKIELEHELQQEKMKSFQNSKLASLGEMAAGVAHEINNPLTISMGKLQFLLKALKKNKADNELIEKELNLAIDSGKRVADIVDSMRSLSRMKEESEFQVISFSDVYKISRPMVSEKLKTHKVDFIASQEEASFKADIGEASQVFINLINNAVDAIKDNKEKKWIKVDVYDEKEEVVIHITDSGILKDRELVEKMFDPFFTTKSIGEGTGLGLSLCKTLMERNNGKIELNDKSLNTSFIITFEKG